MRLAVCATLVWLLLGRRVAAADEPEPTRSYAAQILLADVAAFALGAALSQAEPRVAFLPFLLGGPIVHVVQGQPGRGVGSLALRATLPVGGAFAGMAMRAGCEKSWLDFCRLEAAGIGGIVGAALAISIDAAVLARAPRRRASTVMPAVSVRSGEVSIGVAGSF